MNTAQKIILLLTTTTVVYLLLTTQLHFPPIFNLYNKLASLILISVTLMILTSNLKIKRLSKKEFSLFILSLLLIVVLSVARFGTFGAREIYLLEGYYYSSVGIILCAWLLYYTR